MNVSRSMNQRATIADVARRAGVSIATVSRVMNGTAPVAEETVRSVQEAIAALHFVPQTAAQALAGRRTSTIGLLLPEIGGAFFAPLLRGVEAGAREAGYDLLVHATGGYRKESISGELPHRLLGEQNTDGLLVFIDSLDHQELARLAAMAFPMVLLHQSTPPGLSIPTIKVENKNGAAHIVEHLIVVHHRRRIVFLQGRPEQEDGVWRQRGYCEALQRYNLPFDPLLVAYGDFSEGVAAQAIQHLLAKGITFDAVFSSNDDSATGVLAALRQAGLRVPEDVSVVGFDDAPFARYLSPALTTVHAPTEQVGREGVRQLVNLIRDGQADALTLLPTQLVIRNSCGCTFEEGAKK